MRLIGVQRVRLTIEVLTVETPEMLVQVTPSVREVSDQQRCLCRYSEEGTPVFCIHKCHRVDRGLHRASATTMLLLPQLHVLRRRQVQPVLIVVNVHTPEDDA